MGVKRALEGSRKVKGPEVLDKGWRRASWGREGLGQGFSRPFQAWMGLRRDGEGVERVKKGWDGGQKGDGGLETDEGARSAGQELEKGFMGPRRAGQGISSTGWG